MTALAADRNTPMQDGYKQGYPVAAAAVIYTGALVGVNASGYAVPMSLASGLACVGVAEFQCNNSTGAAGALTVIAQRRKAFRFNNGASITLASVGAMAYAMDDNTVTTTSTGASAVGTIINVDSAGVWVNIA